MSRVGFDDLSIDASSRLLEKTLIETTIKDNGTYAWNRVNTTLDSDRRAESGTNSFWAGNSDEDEYLSSWRKSKYSLSSPIFQKLVDGYKVYRNYFRYNIFKSIFCLFVLSINSVLR